MAPFDGLPNVVVTVTVAPGAIWFTGSVRYGTPFTSPCLLSSVTPAVRPSTTSRRVEADAGESDRAPDDEPPFRRPTP